MRQVWKPSLNPLHRNTGWMLIGNGSRLLIRAAYFILMARGLGAQQYGAFVAVVAAGAIAIPFVGNGFGSLMIKHVARDRRSLPEAFGNLLAVTLISGVLLFGFVVIACFLILPGTIPPAVIVMILASDLLIFPYVGMVGIAFWSLERLGWTAALNALSSFARLIGILVVLLLYRPTLMAWSIAYLATSTLTAMIALGCAMWFLGRPRLALRRAKGELREGFHFAAGLSAQTIYNDVDKTMLARLSTLEATGVYAVAYRLIDIALIPVGAVLSAAYPGFFRQGKDGIYASLHYCRRLLRRVLPYSVFASAGLFFMAPAIPWILGPQYAEATQALRWLAVLPILKTLHFFVADSLTGAGYQGFRALIQIGVAVFNVLVNLWIIPAWGWRGAAWSSIASDGLLALALWLAASRLATNARTFINESPVMAGGAAL